MTQFTTHAKNPGKARQSALDNPESTIPPYSKMKKKTRTKKQELKALEQTRNNIKELGRMVGYRNIETTEIYLK